MATGTIRYWAAARAAAGVVEEPFEAPTLAALLVEVASRHGAPLHRLLPACSVLVDDEPVGTRDPAGVALLDGARVEVLPPFAGGAPAGVELPVPAPVLDVVPVVPVDPTARRWARHSGTIAAMYTRPLVAGLMSAAIAGGLAGASYGGRTVFTLAVLVLQIVAVLGWLAVLDPAGSFGAFVVAMGAAVAGDLLLLRESGAEIGRLAGVFGLAVLAALVHQLSRRPRPRVTESLSGTLSAVVLVIAAASLVGLHGGRGGTQAASVGLIATGAGLLVARVVDRVARGLPSVRGGTRGWPGLVAGAALAGVIGALYGSMAPPLSSRSGLIIGLATGAVALLADLGLDLVAGALRDSALDRQRNALTPVGAFIPIVVAAPAAYVAGRILLG